MTAVAVESIAPELPVELPVEPELVAQELLVEDVSIDGMCGVY